MSKQRTVIVNTREYVYDDLTPDQQTVVNHITDLERKLNSAVFNVQQMQRGYAAFCNDFEVMIASNSIAV